MEIEKFVTECNRRGMCTEAKAKQYCRAHPKDDYEDDDFRAAYRYADYAEARLCAGTRIVSGDMLYYKRYGQTR